MKPTYEITANGKPITSIVGPILRSLTVTDETGEQADAFSLSLDDRGELELPEKGAEIGIKIGYRETGMVDFGIFTVDTVQVSGPPSILQIDGHAAPFSGDAGRIQSRKERSWHGVTVGDLVRKIASEHKLDPVIDQSLDKIEIDHEDQTDESDIAFLARLARDMGAAAKATTGKLAFILRGAGVTSSGKAVPAISLTKSDLSNWSFTFADRGSYKSVSAKYRDVGKAETAEVIVGDGEPSLRLPHVYSSKANAQRAAKTKMSDHKRSSNGTASLTMEGRADLAAETPIKLSGVRQGTDGEWISRRVAHNVTRQGYTTTADIERKV